VEWLGGHTEDERSRCTAWCEEALTVLSEVDPWLDFVHAGVRVVREGVRVVRAGMHVVRVGVRIVLRVARCSGPGDVPPAGAA
jgi:hypothetical protein